MRVGEGREHGLSRQQNYVGSSLAFQKSDAHY